MAIYFTNYDTIQKNYDTKNICKVGNTFYYRKRIKYKLYRISLFTKNLIIAIKRVKILNLMEKDDLLFTLEKGDYKLIFEYDTHDELMEVLKLHNLHENLDIEVEKFENKNRLLKEESTKELEKINFFKLETLFINAKKEEAKKTQRKVGIGTYTKYAQTFSDLKKFFDIEKIDNITKERFEDFRDSLVKKGLQNSTINEKMMYINVFLKFAKVNGFIKENKLASIKSLFVKEVEKDIFTNEDLKNIFNCNRIKDDHKKILKILLYSGMRIMEIYNLSKQNLKTNKDGIKYLNLEITKFDKPRDIPIHKEIEDILFNLDFEKIRNTWKPTRYANYSNEQIFKAIPKIQEKTNHTFRANFVNFLINKFPDQIEVIQEIVGHEKEAKTKLTIKKYGKGFNLEVKKKLIDSLNFNLLN